VDQDDNVLDILVQRRRNKQAAKKFFRKLLKLVFYQFRQLFYAASPLPEHSWDFSDSFSEPHL
jgi:DDE domain